MKNNALQQLALDLQLLVDHGDLKIMTWDSHIQKDTRIVGLTWRGNLGEEITIIQEINMDFVDHLADLTATMLMKTNILLYKE